MIIRIRQTRETKFALELLLEEEEGEFFLLICSVYCCEKGPSKSSFEPTRNACRFFPLFFLFLWTNH